MIGKIVASLIAILLWSAASAAAQGTVKIGLIVPLTGPFSAIGQEIQFGARVFVQHNGTMVAGKTIELIIRDDAGLPDNTKRIAQELVVNDKVSVLTGLGMTPPALTLAPLATEARIPMVVMGAGYETGFKKAYEAAGGTVIASLRVPLSNPDFAPCSARSSAAWRRRRKRLRSGRSRPRRCPGKRRQATGKAAYVGSVPEEGEDVEADEDTVEAELTIAAA